MFRILSVDGGGVRGIFPAHILKRFSEKHGSDLTQIFDLIIGTSTGAIIAAAAATQTPFSKVVDLYEKHSGEIFSPRPLSFDGLGRSKYRSEPLRKVLEEVFGDKTMSSAQTRLILPATDISNGNVFVIKSPYLPTFVRDKDIPLVSAIMASCAAPGYFDPVQVHEYLLADGGLWANNPSLVAYTEAISKLAKPAAEVRILSIGTGIGHQYYNIGEASRTAWGLATGWKRKKLIDTILNLQARSATNSATLLLGNQYKRLTFDETGSLPLDDTSQIAQLKAKAGEVYTYNSDSIKQFLNL